MPEKKNNGRDYTPMSGEPKRDPSFSVDGIFVVLGTESESKTGSKYEAQIGLKIDSTGDPKKDWFRMSYITYKKIHAGIILHKDHFNEQLEIEKSKITGIEAF